MKPKQLIFQDAAHTSERAGDGTDAVRHRRYAKSPRQRTDVLTTASQEEQNGQHYLDCGRQCATGTLL